MKYCLSPKDHLSSLLILVICILKGSVLSAAHPVPNAVGQQVELKVLIELVRDGDLSPTALCLGRQPSPGCVFLVPIARESKVRDFEFSGLPIALLKEMKCSMWCQQAEGCSLQCQNSVGILNVVLTCSTKISVAVEIFLLARE